MLSHQLIAARKFVLSAGLGLTAVFALGCSSQQQAAWDNPIHTVGRAPSAAHETLAAADGLGMIIFGNAPTASEPQLPKNWSLAKADNAH